MQSASGPADTTGYTADGKITGLSYNGGTASVGYTYDSQSTRLSSLYLSEPLSIRSFRLLECHFRLLTS